MQKNRITAFISLFLFLLAIASPVSTYSAAVPRVALRQGASPVARLGQHVGRLSGSTVVSLAVIMNLRNEAGLNQLILAQNTPGSPYYHQFLTPAQFLQAFGPTPQAYNAMVGYLRGSGLQVQITSSRQVIFATGLASRVEQAFGTQLDTYKYEGRLQYGNRTAPTLPSGLAALVRVVQGLDSQVMHPMVMAKPGTAGANFATPSGFSPNQIAKAYDYPQLYGKNGAGKTMAVATAFDFKNGDISTFDYTFGIHIAGYQRVPVAGSPVFDRYESVETTVDVQQSTALAQGARELVYEVNYPSFVNFTREYEKIVSDNKADAVTSSWGACEFDNYDFGDLSQDDGILAEGAAQGQSWFIADGDGSGNECGGGAQLYPAVSPYVTAASGTSLTLSNTGSISTESAWSGTGGGYSEYEVQPSWQTGSTYFNETNYDQKNRWVGDYAMDADPYTGMAVLFTEQWAIYGGTSFVAPFGAALAASIAGYKGSRLGIFAVRLYALGSTASATSASCETSTNPTKLPTLYSTGSMHDITSGNNGPYSAGCDWDPATGWGSPDGYMLMLNY